MGLAVGTENAGEGSLGLATVRRSSEVIPSSESPTQLAARQDPPLPALDAREDDGPAADEIQLLKARLAALEHVLEAVRALLDVGAIQEALNLLRGCRRG